MNQPTTLQGLEKAILSAIDKELDSEKERIIKYAVEQFETKVRSIVARSAVQLANLYTIDRMMNEIRITVRIDSDQKI